MLAVDNNLETIYFQRAVFQHGKVNIIANEQGNKIILSHIDSLAQNDLLVLLKGIMLQ